MAGDFCADGLGFSDGIDIVVGIIGCFYQADVTAQRIMLGLQAVQRKVGTASLLFLTRNRW
jgi:hypothetical protein